eukprot:scaffold20532_cov123-Isochrysis_galbana.AAC.9
MNSPSRIAPACNASPSVASPASPMELACRPKRVRAGQAPCPSAPARAATPASPNPFCPAYSQRSCGSAPWERALASAVSEGTTGDWAAREGLEGTHGFRVERVAGQPEGLERRGGMKATEESIQPARPDGVAAEVERVERAGRHLRSRWRVSWPA